MQTRTQFFDERFLKSSKSDILELLRLKGHSVEFRMSDLLIEQLRMGLVTNYIHPEKVVWEITIMESGSATSRTKAAAPFDRGILAENGLWKKHFFQSRFLPQNVINEMQFDRKKSKKFEQIEASVRRKTTSDWDLSVALANQVVHESFDERAKRGELTGEWIIFKKHEGNNFYLTLASHEEDYNEIYCRILEGCASQFPFLFDAADTTPTNS